MQTKHLPLFAIIILISFLSNAAFSQDTLRLQNVEAILYGGKGGNQPLLVGLGGSEGGNAWASDHWKKTREDFLNRGYAFLAIGYFGAKGTPEILDKIAIEDVYRAISAAKGNPQIDSTKIAIIGGSRGADLALLLGSYYPDISAVVGMSASHAVFPGHTQDFASSCWTYHGKELPYVPVNEESVPFLMKRDLRGAFEAMLQDTSAEKKALIKVERIQGPILLLSAKGDEIIPAVAMGNKMVERLKAADFRFPFEHIVYEGSHAETTRHFDVVIGFLERYFKGN